MYIPVCPLTEYNANHLQRSRQSFLDGIPSPDFPGGKGESEHVNRCGEDYLRANTTMEGLCAAGFGKLVARKEDTVGAKEVQEKANAILGFA